MQKLITCKATQHQQNTALKLNDWTQFLIITYVVLLLIWLGLWLVIGDTFWWLTLINRVVPYLFFPMPIIFLLGLIFRQYRLILISLIPPLLFGLLYGPYLIPRLAQPGDTPHLRVMTYNVLYSNENHNAVADVILTHRPDLVALQEVQPEMMSSLVERLAKDYPYSSIGYQNQYGTTAAFSRYPVTDSYILDLKADRPAVVLHVDLEGKELTFISAHLLAYDLWEVTLPDIPHTVNRFTANQNKQARLLLETVKKHSGPIILACDCNSKETSSSYQILNHSITNTARQIGWTIGRSMLAGTKPDTSLQHIDYVFYQGPLNPVAIYSIRNSGGSDHWPVMANFNFE